MFVLNNTSDINTLVYEPQHSAIEHFEGDLRTKRGSKREKAPMGNINKEAHGHPHLRHLRRSLRYVLDAV